MPLNLPGRMRGCFPPEERFILWARSASAAKAEWLELLSNAKTATQPGCIFSNMGMAFSLNDDKKYSWAPKGEHPLKKKGRGKGFMISGFLLDTVGRLAVPEDVYAAIEEPPFPREACEVFEYGGEKGYWTGEHVVKQVD